MAGNTPTYGSFLSSLLPPVGRGITGITQWKQNLEQDEGQRLAAAAKKEGTETRVYSWLEDVKALSPQEKLAALENAPNIKNFEAAYAYAKYLAQSQMAMPAPSAMETLRGTTGGPAGAGIIGQLLKGEGAGVPPFGRISPEMGMPYFEEAIRPHETKYGEAFRPAAMEEYKKLPRTEPYFTPEEMWKGEAREAKELVGAEKWWQETEPEKLVVAEREQALKNAENLIGEYGYKWVTARMKNLKAPEWIESLSDEKKMNMGLRKTKEGTYEILPIYRLDPETGEKVSIDADVQAAYIDLMRMPPPKLEDFSAAERTVIRTIVEGGRVDPVLAMDKPWLAAYVRNPLAQVKDEGEIAQHIIALISEIPLPQVRMIMELIGRPYVREIVGAGEKEKPENWFKSLLSRFGV